jgi:hypothetical protein
MDASWKAFDEVQHWVGSSVATPKNIVAWKVSVAQVRVDICLDTSTTIDTDTDTVFEVWKPMQCTDRAVSASASLKATVCTSLPLKPTTMC